MAADLPIVGQIGENEPTAVDSGTTMNTEQDSGVRPNGEPRLYQRIRELGKTGHALGAWLTMNVKDAPVPIVELAEGLGLGVEIVDGLNVTAKLDLNSHTVSVSREGSTFEQRYALARCIADAILRTGDEALEACADALLVPPHLFTKYLGFTDDRARLARVFGVPQPVIERRY